MPRLRNMVGDTGTIEIPVSNDEPLIVTYRRRAGKPKTQMKLLAMQRQINEGGEGLASADAVMGMCELMADLVESWNLEDDEGSPIGTDVDSITEVDIEILTRIVEEIGRSVGPDPLSGNDSSDGSSPLASSEPKPFQTTTG